MGRYQGYSEYKSYESVFINSIPSHWEVKPLFTLCRFRQGKAHEPFVDDDGEYICVNSRFVSTGAQKVKYCTVNLTPANLKDVLMVMSDLPNGRALAKAFYVNDDKKYAVNQRVCALTAQKINAKFLYYQLDRSPYFLMYDDGSNQTHLSNEAYRKYPVLVPFEEEQQKIANFLDHETAKIDTLIEKQQQLIKLLKEKRQAVISHAVTKGLNPNAPMRDSGVEWLGEVPEHWVVAQLKFNTLEMQTGPFGSQLHAEDYVIDGIPLINPAHMISGKIVPDSKVTVDKETQDRLSRHRLSEGEIIFARRGELGRCAIVMKEQEGWLCGTGSLKARLNNQLIPEYAYLLITSDGVVSELSLESKGSTMDNLNTETLGRVRMPVPPGSEQNDILKYVDDVSGIYKSLINAAQAAIGLMQERRTALISAAVTGKIDVRSWQAPEPSTTTTNKNKEVAV